MQERYGYESGAGLDCGHLAPSRYYYAVWPVSICHPGAILRLPRRSHGGGFVDVHIGPIPSSKPQCSNVLPHTRTAHTTRGKVRKRRASSRRLRRYWWPPSWIILNLQANTKQAHKLRQIAREYSFALRAMPNLDRLVGSVVKEHVSFADLIQVAVGMVNEETNANSDSERNKFLLKQTKTEITDWINESWLVSAIRESKRYDLYDAQIGVYGPKLATLTHPHIIRPLALLTELRQGYNQEWMERAPALRPYG
ncbi:ATP-binding protein [Cupriavidus oxalaticus]|uniref:ATP-binding protein n=1 Tax=Cupriavidus oxalaticus TaxID=96344 RepID=UPI0014384DEA|nr:ATP-binding protein [Cupriavidus oxalaticus]